MISASLSPKQFVMPIQGEQIHFQGVNYYIGAPIGYGAFGSVMECSDDWGNQLAAKVLLPTGSYEDVRRAWQDEMSKLITLRHPNITYIHAAFEYRETFYIILERCAYDLGALIRSNNFDGKIWIPHVARDVLFALNKIHEWGYVHKDLHPGNIFIAHHFDSMVPQKEPVWSFKIADFGISNIEGNIRQAQTRMAKWMFPPELISAEFGSVSRATDFYHFGLILLNMLVPNMSDFSQEQIIEGRPRMIAELLPSPYAPVIAKSLRRHVQYRYQSAIEFWGDIWKSSREAVN